MARGKSRPPQPHKAQRGRATAKAISSSTAITSQNDSCKIAPADVWPSSSRALPHEPIDALCNHRDIDEIDMTRVSKLLSDVFSISFKTSVPLMFQGMAQSMQGIVIREMMLDFLESGNELRSLKEFARSQSTRDSISAQLEEACRMDLCEVVTHLSTEDGFDLVCDLSLRHGHDTQTWGPPCACSLTACLGCLQSLVKDMRDKPLVHPSAQRPFGKDEIAAAIRDVGNGSKVGVAGPSTDPWIDTIAETWHCMTDIYWETAEAMDAMSIKCVKETYSKLSSMNGVVLWYAVAAREVEACTLQTRSKGKGAFREAQQSCTCCKLQLDEFAALAAKAEKDPFAVCAREMLAHVCRRQGNTAFDAGRFQDAADHYTRAIGYDANEAVYPLNRAACRLKLGQYEEAEVDCSSSILLDVSNHKAWFRRGIIRSHQNKMESASQDFEHALEMRKDNEKEYNELAELGRSHLIDAALRIGSRAEDVPKFASLDDTLAMQRNGSSSISSGAQCSTAGDCSVEEVFTQVMFAIAFSQIVHRKTGVNIKVPISELDDGGPKARI